MGTHGHEHELPVKVVLPEELLGTVGLGGEAHVTGDAVARHEDIAAVKALEAYLALPAVDEAELGEETLVGGVGIIDEAVGRGVHGQARGEVDDAERLAVRYVVAAVGLGLQDGEVVKLGITSVAPVLVEGKEREAGTLEGDELVGQGHGAAYGMERGAVGGVLVVPPVVVEVTVETEPDASVGKRDVEVGGVVPELFEAAEREFLTFLDDARPGARHVDVAQAGHVAVLEVSHVEFHGGEAGRTYDTLREGVAGPHELFGGLGMQLQASALELPHPVIGIVVPLPHASERLAVEVLAALVGSVGLDVVRTRDVGLEPGARRTSQVAFESQHRPSVLPGDGCQRHGATDGVEVHHEEGIPVALLRLHDASLVDVGACRGILVEGTQGKLGAVGHDAPLHLGERGSVVAEGLVGGDGDGLVGSPDTLGARAERTSVGLVVSGDEVVHAIDLVHVVSLAHGISLGDDDAVGLLLGSAHVGLEFGAVYLTVAVYGIYLAVIVKEHAEVIDASLHVVVLPGTADVGTGVALEPLAVDVGEDVELSVGIAYGGSPDALSVYLLVVAEPEGIVLEVEAVEAVADVLPVDEVARVEDDESGHGVHGGSGQVVVIADTDDVGVGELIIEERIGEGPVAVVSRPGRSLCSGRECQGSGKA